VGKEYILYLSRILIITNTQNNERFNFKTQKPSRRLRENELPIRQAESRTENEGVFHQRKFEKRVYKRRHTKD